MSASDFLYDRKCLHDWFQYFQRRASTDTLKRPNVLLWFQIQNFKKKVELKASCLEKCHYYEIQDYINHQSNTSWTITSSFMSLKGKITNICGNRNEEDVLL